MAGEIFIKRNGSLSCLAHGVANGVLNWEMGGSERCFPFKDRSGSGIKLLQVWQVVVRAPTYTMASGCFNYPLIGCYLLRQQKVKGLCSLKLK
jgi:hypothetical protein